MARLNAPGNSLNGVFAYSASSTFPNNTSTDTADNFWVDVVFNDSGHLPPVLGNLTASATYAVGGTATTLSPGTTVSDPESTTPCIGIGVNHQRLPCRRHAGRRHAGTNITASYDRRDGRAEPDRQRHAGALSAGAG